jgi:hypothetical protein
MFAIVISLGCATQAPQPQPQPETETNAPAKPDDDVLYLSSERWQKQTTGDFEWSGEVEVSEDTVKMAEGEPYTGVRWPGSVPRENYEIELEARRTKGSDIFCGLTVPVGDEHVSFILGGWGDCVVGLSNVDDFNASENDTTESMGFTNGDWYRVKMRVTPERIDCWIDGKQVVECERAEHTFSTYEALRPLHPLGVFTWMSSGEIRSAEVRRIPATPPSSD